MNTTSNINAMQGVGAVSSSSGLAKGQASQDLLGFLATIMQQLQGDVPTQNAPAVKDVAEKISAALEKQGLSEDDMKAMPADELAGRIATLLPPGMPTALTAQMSSDVADYLQQNGFVEAATGVRPSLISDLLAPQTSQAATEEAGAPAVSIDASLLAKLQDKVSDAQAGLDVTNEDAVAAFKADILQFLKDQGLDDAAAKQYLAALARTVKQAAAAAADTNGITLATLSSIQSDASLPTAPGVPAPNDPVLGALSKGLAAKAEKTSSIANPAQQASAAANLRPQLATADTAAKAAAQHNITARISGSNIVNPAMIQDLAGGDSNTSGFGAGGFGAQGQSAQDTPDTSALLQPVSADALIGKQTFTNYMNAARSLPSPTVQMVNVQIQRNVSAGINNMTIQLDPAELGRMDVRLKFGKDGSVKAHMTVDKPETLALLQKDAHHLQRALQQSGIDADEHSLSFDLRQDGRQENLEGYDGKNAGRPSTLSASADMSSNDNALQALIAVPSYGYITASGVNIMV